MSSILWKELVSVWKFGWRSSSVRKKERCFCMELNMWCATPTKPLPSSYLVATVVIWGRQQRFIRKCVDEERKERVALPWHSACASGSHRP